MKRMLTTAAAPDETHICERRNTGQHKRNAVSQLSTVILVIASRHDHLRTVTNVSAQRHHTEHVRQRLVGPPVRRQRRAGEVRAVGSNKTVGSGGGPVA